MDWRTKVELFAQIRREYAFGIGTIMGVARKLGVHWRMVRAALKSPLPCKRKRPERVQPSLAPVKPFIDDILEADRKAPRLRSLKVRPEELPLRIPSMWAPPGR